MRQNADFDITTEVSGSFFRNWAAAAQWVALGVAEWPTISSRQGVEDRYEQNISSGTRVVARRVGVGKRHP